jgi:hypothetical protein
MTPVSERMVLKQRISQRKLRNRIFQNISKYFCYGKLNDSSSGTLFKPAELNYLEP